MDLLAGRSREGNLCGFDVELRLALNVWGVDSEIDDVLAVSVGSHHWPSRVETWQRQQQRLPDESSTPHLFRFRGG